MKKFAKKKNSTSRTTRAPATDRQLYISKDKLDELRNCKSTLKVATERARHSEHRLAQLQVENTRLDQERLQLFSELQSSRSQFSYQNSGYFKLPTGRVVDCRRYVSNVNVLLTSHYQSIARLDLPGSMRKQISKTVKKLIQNFDKLSFILTDEVVEDDNRNTETLYRDSSEQYNRIISKVKKYKTVLTEKMRILEKSDKSRNEQGKRIKHLEEEKMMLNSHIQSLQETVAEQSTAIENLRLSQARCAFPPLPAESRNPYSEQYYHSHVRGEKQIQNEISVLDLEIQSLRNSLERALSTCQTA